LNKIESVGLRKCPCYRYLIEKVMSTDVSQQIFRIACPTKWRKTADMKKLRHCHPMYNWAITDGLCNTSGQLNFSRLLYNSTKNRVWKACSGWMRLTVT